MITQLIQEDVLKNALVRGIGFAFCLCFLIIAAGSVYAQNDTAMGHKATAVQEGLEKSVTLDADDSFLPAILTILAQKSGFNIVTGPGVNREERISVHIKDTPIDEAINLVVRAAGLSYEIVGNSFLVASPEALEREVGLSSYVYDLQFANAAELKELLRDLTKYVQVDTSGNRIMALASPKVASEISNIIRRIDVAPRQIMLEARLIEVATDDLDEYGIDWQKLSSLTTIIAESPLNADGSSRAPSLQSSDFKESFLDKKPDDLPYQKIEGFDNIGHFSRQLNAFDITLDFLLKRNKAKLLAHSKLTTVNNRAAKIHIGETLRWAVVSERNAIVEKEDVGITLDITPTINSDGYITTKVQPEVSSVIELVQGLYPRKKIRTATTTVLVKDGQKIFIGGLLSVEDTENEYAMPVLSQIPLIGRLFKHTEHTTRKTDLIIEITPRVIKPEVEFSDASNYSSDGYQIRSTGQITNLRMIEPEIDELYEVESNQQMLREFQNKTLEPMLEPMEDNKN